MGSRTEGSGDVEYAQHLVANCRLGLGIAKHEPLDKHRIVSHLITCTKLNAGGKTNLCSRLYLSVDCLCGADGGDECKEVFLQQFSRQKLEEVWDIMCCRE